MSEPKKKRVGCLPLGCGGLLALILIGLVGSELSGDAAADRDAERRADAVRDSLSRLGVDAGHGPMPGGTASVRSGVRDALATGAWDANSIDVERCTNPTLDPEAGWVVTCGFSGTNAFGATVTDAGRFVVTQRGPSDVVAEPVD